MKSIIKPLSFVAVLASVLTSCEEQVRLGEWVYTTHFIQYASTINSLECRADEENGVLNLYFSGKNIQLEDFLTEIGDMGYDRKVDRDPTFASVISERFIDIDIISSERFIDVPAGESIARYVLLRSSVILPYIESKYTEEGDWTDDIMDEFNIGRPAPMTPRDSLLDQRRYAYHPIVTPLDEVEPEELFTCYYNDNSLRFTAVPEIKSHVFTIIVNTPNGRVTCDVPYVFR